MALRWRLGLEAGHLVASEVSKLCLTSLFPTSDVPVPVGEHCPYTQAQGWNEMSQQWYTTLFEICSSIVVL